MSSQPVAASPPLLLDLFGDRIVEPLRPPTRRERQRVAVQARHAAAAAAAAAASAVTLPSPAQSPPETAAPVESAPAPSCAEPLHPAVWRASELGRATTPCVASGHRPLDAALPGGGWPTRTLIELLLPSPGATEWRLLGPALARCLRQDTAPRQLLLIGPPHEPHLRGLAAWGIAARHCLWVKAESPRERLWALEQTLKADPDALAAVLAWLPQANPEQLRRLQTLAAGCRALVFVLRPDDAGASPSAAPLRLRVAPGAHWARLNVQVLKRQGPPLDAALDLFSPPPTLRAVLPLPAAGQRRARRTRDGRGAGDIRQPAR